MGWSDKQRFVFLAACRAAELNDGQRYVVMRHAGCPPVKHGETSQPSVKCPSNSNDSFVACMAIVEGHAAMKGRDVSPPAGKDSWADAAKDTRARLIHLAERIAGELVERVPDVFNAGTLSGMVVRMTEHDHPDITLNRAPRTIQECDEGQLYRVIEAMKAWGSREFLKRDIRPRTFTINRREEKASWARQARAMAST